MHDRHTGRPGFCLVKQYHDLVPKDNNVKLNCALEDIGGYCMILDIIGKTTDIVIVSKQCIDCSLIIDSESTFYNSPDVNLTFLQYCMLLKKTFL